MKFKSLKIKSWIATLVVFMVAFMFEACTESSVVKAEAPELGKINFDGFEIESIDSLEKTISIKPRKDWVDSMVVGDVLPLGGASLYLAADHDMEDPELGDELLPGTVISTKDTNAFSIVVLDDKNRITSVWLITWDVPEIETPVASSSSKDTEKSSSSSQDSLEVEILSSSSEKNESSSSKEEIVENLSSSSQDSLQNKPSLNESSSSILLGSSSSEKISSSSEVLSSSSLIEESSSSEETVLSSEKSVSVCQFNINGDTEAGNVNNDTKTITLALEDKGLLNSIQVKRLIMTSTASVTLKTNTSLSFVQINDTTYSYNFTITAQNGESDNWSILINVPKGILLSKLSCESCTINVNNDSIYVELPYLSDLAQVKLSPLDTTNNLERYIPLDFIDDNGNLKTYQVVAGYQIPGSDFSKREDSFFATTSDAMATSKTAAAITIAGSANLAFENSIATLTSSVISGAFIGISGTWKLAGGYYYSGSYAGTTALDIYEQGYSSGTPSTGASDFSKDMTFGKPFTARPKSFDVTYAYNHTTANNDSNYPQKSLIYVMLLSADNKVVATGVITDIESVPKTTKTVELSYGSDPSKLLESGFAGTTSLTLGSGLEDVKTIRIMFASSAYGHVAVKKGDGFRGGEGASLSIDNFRFNY